MQVEFDVRLDAGTLYDHLVYRAYSHTPGIMETAAGALLVIVFGMTGNLLCLIAGLVILAWLPASLWRKAARKAKQPDFQQPLHYILTEEGVEIFRKNGKDFWKWEEMEKAVSTSKSVILYTVGDSACIFPRRELKDSLIPAVEMISTHMSPRKVNIRM
ncbi:MAG TPA: YcxB family protein [Candidatus Eisenbergiella merdipullorum]|uniref:YcxB family protein n=1 Tax=Candidatus Eisenbergiella merdipullorum TaxID=2838553 RepID=A0A9D2I566_9FIRM|nr:YcxB family protein [Candidatus Eisenbergiella merdipullorum]